MPNKHLFSFFSLSFFTSIAHQTGLIQTKKGQQTLQFGKNIAKTNDTFESKQLTPLSPRFIWRAKQWGSSKQLFQKKSLASLQTLSG